MKLASLRIAGNRAYPPRSSAFTQTFWNALGDGRWITTRCQACKRQSFPPKSVCPHCWAQGLEWSDLPITGAVYSWTRIHVAPTAFAPEAPYALGIVDLEGGPRIACRLVPAKDAELKIGKTVEMIVLQFDDGPLFAGRVLP